MWAVSRHSGRKNDPWKVKYEGNKEQAIKVYEKIKAQMRRGSVALIDDTNSVIASVRIH